MGILSWLKRRRRGSISTKTTSRTRSARTWRSPTEEKIADGADRQDARYAALKEFGNVTLTTEAARRRLDARAGSRRCAISSSDVRYAIRALAKNPASRSPSSACSRSASA